ncbi:hypothetical protein HDV05_000810 [Chytridiales sp. JEL 0842]|nr:hypothetical protein HDV05_000810 [Chytridiales sp. JEL 0842]
MGNQPSVAAKGLIVNTNTSNDKRVAPLGLDNDVLADDQHQLQRKWSSKVRMGMDTGSLRWNSFWSKSATGPTGTSNKLRTDTPITLLNDNDALPQDEISSVDAINDTDVCVRQSTGTLASELSTTNCQHTTAPPHDETNDIPKDACFQPSSMDYKLAYDALQEDYVNCMKQVDEQKANVGKARMVAESYLRQLEEAQNTIAKLEEELRRRSEDEYRCIPPNAESMQSTSINSLTSHKLPQNQQEELKPPSLLPPIPKEQTGKQYLTSISVFERDIQKLKDELAVTTDKYEQRITKLKQKLRRQKTEAAARIFELEEQIKGMNLCSHYYLSVGLKQEDILELSQTLKPAINKSLPPLPQASTVGDTISSLREQIEKKNQVIMRLSMQVSELDLELQQKGH